MFSYAVKRKLVAVSPCKGVEKPADVKRNRRLGDAEYPQLGSALKGEMVSDIFLFLAVTGFRSSEAKNLRWYECDLERSIVTLGDTKTGVSVRPLSDVAIAIIKRRKEVALHTCLITDMASQSDQLCVLGCDLKCIGT